MARREKGKQKAQPTNGKQNISPKKPRHWMNARGQVVNTAELRRPQPPDLLVDVANDAESAWRRHEKPNASLTIPQELALQDDHYKAIAEQNGTFIYNDLITGPSGSMKFGIWGDAKAVAATQDAVDAWIKEWKAASRTKSHRSEKFAKVKSLTPTLQAREEKKWLREVEKQKWRRHPPFGSEFGAIGTFHWPTQEYRPENILGVSTEALDPIRTACECYVVFKKERSTFEVSGTAKNVQESLLRLRKTYFQIAARSMPTIRAYLLHWPHAAVLPSHVHLEPYEHTKPLSSDTPPLIGNVPFGDGELHDETPLERQRAVSEASVRTLMMQTVKKLHYYRGSIQMRIHLGTFLATQFRKPKDGKYELEEYEDMIKESQFIGQVTAELGDRSKELAALEAVQRSEELFQPQDAITEKLSAVRPAYSVTFTFADEGGDICLTIFWVETEDAGASVSSFEQISKKWTRLERDTGAAVPLLDISLCNLNTGMAWQFDIHASQSIDESRLSKNLIDFGRSVQINSKVALNQVFSGTTNSFITYKPYSVKLRHMRQSLSYRYHIRNNEGYVTDYTFDLTRFQDRSFPAHEGTSLIAAAQPIVYEARWSVNVIRTEWDVMFAANENLKIGERADWKDDTETWFPEDYSKGREESKGAGFEHLMESLKRIGKLVRDVEQDDLLGEMGGMTVG